MPLFPYHSEVSPATLPGDEGAVEIPLNTISPLADELALYLDERQGVAVLLDKKAAQIRQALRLSSEHIALLACLCLFPLRASLEMLFACSDPLSKPLFQQREQDLEQVRKLILLRVIHAQTDHRVHTEAERVLLFNKISKLRTKIAAFHLELFFKDQGYRLMYAAPEGPLPDAQSLGEPSLAPVAVGSRQG